MAARYLGKMGEKALTFWCSQVGIIANKADEDLAGWDHLVEFPLAAPSTPNPAESEDLAK
ncbi:MAG: hypothetical protein IPO81_03155 [Kouleothrix sp.]|nr:hypothetical protein [Kouleothrix sp.]